MKWLFYLLVVANLGFYVWQTNTEPAATETSWHAGTADEIRQLLLVREMDPDQIRRIPLLTAPETSVPSAE